MKISKIQKGLFLMTIAAGALAVGCELIVDFDRTKIPVEGADASLADVSIPDGSSVLPGDAGSTTDASDAGSTSDASDASDQ